VLASPILGGLRMASDQTVRVAAAVAADDQIIRGNLQKIDPVDPIQPLAGGAARLVRLDDRPRDFDPPSVQLARLSAACPV
jgi:hypothetical protein